MKPVLYILVSFLAVSSSLLAMLLLYNPHMQIFQLLPGIKEGIGIRGFVISAIFISGITGCLHLVAIFHLIQKENRAYNCIIAGNIFVMMWTILNMMMIGAAYPIYLIYLLIALMSFLIAYQLKGKWAL